MDQQRYPGGIAIWGAVPPAFNSSRRAVDRGVHVHARETPNGTKVIDQSYPAVTFNIGGDLFNPRRAVITAPTAISYLASTVACLEPKHLYCVHCGEVHLDADYYAVHPHKRHLCHACGRNFQDSARGVSNPIVVVQKLFKPRTPPIRPGRCFDIRQREFLGGIQLWGSNPALIWTADKAEEEGIHVHAYPEHDTDEGMEDNTFDDVRIDGVHLDEVQLRYLMVQNSLAYLKGKIVSLDCPSCGTHHFDEGRDAFHPHINHPCHVCKTVLRSTGRNQKTVSNPIARVLRELKSAAAEG
jgi:NAD-dependent SIR2 family protein deacetylase